MTTQEAYEKIRGWFLTDQRFGYNTQSGDCLYRTADGAACAVGCLIPDGNPMLRESGGITELQRNFPNEFEMTFVGVDSTFLTRVQSAHDNEAMEDDPSIDTFIESLDRLAKAHGLQVPA